MGTAIVGDAVDVNGLRGDIDVDVAVALAIDGVFHLQGGTPLGFDGFTKLDIRDFFGQEMQGKIAEGDEGIGTDDGIDGMGEGVDRLGIGEIKRIHGSCVLTDGILVVG